MLHVFTSEGMRIKKILSSYYFTSRLRTALKSYLMFVPSAEAPAGPEWLSIGSLHVKRQFPCFRRKIMRHGISDHL